MHTASRPNGQRGLEEAFRCVGAKNKKVIVDWVSTYSVHRHTLLYACLYVHVEEGRDVTSALSREDFFIRICTDKSV